MITLGHVGVRDIVEVELIGNFIGLTMVNNRGLRGRWLGCGCTGLWRPIGDL